MESTQLARSQSSGRDWPKRCSQMLTTLESAVSRAGNWLTIDYPALHYTTPPLPYPSFLSSLWPEHPLSIGYCFELSDIVPCQLNSWEWENSFVSRSLHSFYGGWLVPKPSFEIWDTEITFGWSVMEAIASFEWSTQSFEWWISISKCKCSHLNGELLLDTQLFEWSTSISKCECCYLNG